MDSSWKTIRKRSSGYDFFPSKKNKTSKELSVSPNMDSKKKNKEKKENVCKFSTLFSKTIDGNNTNGLQFHIQELNGVVFLQMRRFAFGKRTQHYVTLMRNEIESFLENSHQFLTGDEFSVTGQGFNLSVKSIDDYVVFQQKRGDRESEIKMTRKCFEVFKDWVEIFHKAQGMAVDSKMVLTSLYEVVIERQRSKCHLCDTNPFVNECHESVSCRDMLWFNGIQSDETVVHIAEMFDDNEDDNCGVESFVVEWEKPALEYLSNIFKFYPEINDKVKKESLTNAVSKLSNLIKKKVPSDLTNLINKLF